MKCCTRLVNVFLANYKGSYARAVQLKNKINIVCFSCVIPRLCTRYVLLAVRNSLSRCII